MAINTKWYKEAHKNNSESGCTFCLGKEVIAAFYSHQNVTNVTGGHVAVGSSYASILFKFGSKAYLS